MPMSCGRAPPWYSLVLWFELSLFMMQGNDKDDNIDNGSEDGMDDMYHASPRLYNTDFVNPSSYSSDVRDQLEALRPECWCNSPESDHYKPRDDSGVYMATLMHSVYNKDEDKKPRLLFGCYFNHAPERCGFYQMPFQGMAREPKPMKPANKRLQLKRRR
jgi:hypothetical protein